MQQQHQQQYEILSLNPPLPIPPNTPVRVRKKAIARKRRALEKLKKERKKKGLPIDDLTTVNNVPTMDTLVKSYLRRHEHKLKEGISPSAAKQQEEYYNNLLLGQGTDNDDILTSSKSRFLSPSSLQTAMGRKSMLIENAYAFALRQQEVMLTGDNGKTNNKDHTIMTEQESINRVEELLREESRANRHMGRKTAENVKGWRAAMDDDETGDDDTTAADAKKEEEDDKTLPSILHHRPRAIRALNIWSARLSSIPYSRWTVGASTALDHWIAREVLQMEEQTWQLVLESGGTDAYVEGMDTLVGGESKRGLNDRMRDIVVVRGALFPETLMESTSSDGKIAGLTGDVDDDLLSEGDSTNATEKSIDELLASLGEEDDDDFDFKFDDDEDEEEKKREEGDEKEDIGDEVNDEKLASIMDELQVWRGRNVSSPYEAWDADRKSEFDVSFITSFCCFFFQPGILFYVHHIFFFSSNKTAMD